MFLTHPEPPYPTIAPNLRATMEKTLEWVHELQDISGFPSETQAWAAMRAVLHTLRDRLTPDEAADLASQMPMLLRGMYYEGYNPGSTPLRLRTREQFIEIVERTPSQNDWWKGRLNGQTGSFPANYVQVL